MSTPTTPAPRGAPFDEATLRGSLLGLQGQTERLTAILADLPTMTDPQKVVAFLQAAETAKLAAQAAAQAATDARFLAGFLMGSGVPLGN